MSALHLTMVTQAFWLVLSVVSIVGARTLESANCTDRDFNWMYNAQGQSPCYVAEQLADVCNPGGVTLVPLDAGVIYYGPELNQTSYCECSSIFYSLVSACAACQDRGWLNWSDFSQNCSRPTVSTWVQLSITDILDYPFSSFMGTVPSNTTIPSYASLNVTEYGTFNVSAAYKVVTGSSSMPSHSSKTGPIVGAVVACIAALAIAGLLLFWFYRRRRRTVIDRLPKRSHYVSLSDPVTSTGTTYPQPVYQPEKRRDSLNGTYLPMQPSELN
ncbi:hypothetical protein F5887DRAFT_977398 [Amanita rubescens]|nr:hypothetical protein F5887DRAFT_980996 [Amanita rubescens]KAF8340957.1 hypothetical protein F5887DRAFT_977398 [Amanita rubescens]